MSLESEQIALEKIHRLSKLIQHFVSRHDNKILVRRLCVGYLRDLGRLTDQLFETYGARAIGILSELESLEASFLRIKSAKGMSTDVDLQHDDENFEIDESPIVEILVQQGRFEFAVGEKLLNTIIDVREKEKTFDFQQRVWTDKKRMAMKMECSVDHFTSVYYENFFLVTFIVSDTCRFFQLLSGTAPRRFRHGLISHLPHRGSNP